MIKDEQTFIALVGIMHLTLQYPVVCINTTEKCNYVEDEEHIFYINNLQSNVIFLKKMSIFSNFFAHAQWKKCIILSSNYF